MAIKILIGINIAQLLGAVVLGAVLETSISEAFAERKILDNIQVLRHLTIRELGEITTL